MELAITIGIGLTLFLLGLWGIWRGVRAGLVTLVGTILAAEFVHLWQEPMAEALWEWGWDSPVHTYSGAMFAFLTIVLVVGYGSEMLLEPRMSETSLFERFVGGLLGLLNGALIVGYSLHHTVELLQDEILSETILRTMPSRLLYDWLPWFLLATTVFLMGKILFRGARALLDWRTALIEAQLLQRELATPPSSSSSPSGTNPAATPRSSPSASQDRKIIDKINQRLGR